MKAGHFLLMTITHKWVMYFDRLGMCALFIALNRSISLQVCLLFGNISFFTAFQNTFATGKEVKNIDFFGKLYHISNH